MSKLVKNEVLMLNIGSMCTGARVIAVDKLFYLCHPHSVLIDCTRTAVAQCYLPAEQLYLGTFGTQHLCVLLV